jgi:CheY-like chemotaxis protein
VAEKRDWQALIVDDNWFVRDVSALTLRQVGYQVSEAANGEEALLMLASQNFDLLILDLWMPKVDGLAVLDRMQKHPNRDRMRILVLTANPHLATPQVVTAADHVMIKPLDIHEMARFARRAQNDAYSS